MADDPKCRYCSSVIDPEGPAVSQQIPLGERRMPAVYVPFVGEWPLLGRRDLSHPVCFGKAEGIDALLEAVARHDHEARPDRVAHEVGEPILVTLTAEERRLLRRGLFEWGGPASPTRELAIAMGFADVADLVKEAIRIADVIEQERALTTFDWSRALVATEFAFASDVFGSGVIWPTTAGRGDAETIETLRGVQRKLSQARVIVVPGYRTW